MTAQIEVQKSDIAAPANDAAAIAAVAAECTDCKSPATCSAAPGKRLKSFEPIAGGVTTPQGFQASGVHVGVKRKRKDLALLWSALPCISAGVFTTNSIKGAPVIWSQDKVSSGNAIHGVVVNSGNANSCTGALGTYHTTLMAQSFAACMGVEPENVLVASTGIIGVPLPIEAIRAGIPPAATRLGHAIEAGNRAAEAIVTTDTFLKQAACRFELNGKTVHIGAMAKGSGMVHPNMATMLAFITTDAAISKEMLQGALSQSVKETYNMISVDGDTSTNDMVLALANGLAANKPIIDKNDDYETFCNALTSINRQLAIAIASDGEGATKLLEVTISSASSDEVAAKLARAVVSSNLVKTSLFSEDANWGRIIAAMGSTGCQIAPNRICISILDNETATRAPLIVDGIPYWTDEAYNKSLLARDKVAIFIDLQSGRSSATAWGCDLTVDYVRITGDYRTRSVFVGVPAAAEVLQPEATEGVA